ncbi:DUF1598 domain-containing protein [Chlorobium ferrooxidans]|uniref:Uncharacterized protein n=1 Tax=Chlorobium ferrooxidans DSM 13031 TaxID=377431 RepID=Q0YP27_9CHLB|nr:DUF1598 domain-containing protein [Chlorobium ferrooxidans]EAT58042.1 hypothetical protein CferDRAFT_0058 [Chlorobium ferrooxidans DSM 13031]
MKIRFFAVMVMVLSCFLSASAAWCKAGDEASVKSLRTPAVELPTRAISLRILQQRLQDDQKKGAYDKKLLLLNDLTTVSGYVFDRSTNDLILIGRVEAGQPPLHLEDFVVALRNTWFKYAVLKGNTYYYTYPGCSIDPDPEVMRRLQQVGEKIVGASSQTGIQEWQSTCRLPQSVRVLGIPFDTHFAQVMVNADYDMKRVVDGTDSLNIQGFSSLTDITMSRAKTDIIQGRSLSIPRSSLNRFWFYPGENAYVQDQGIITIKNSPVTLLTEAEYIGQSGKILGAGQTDALAVEFTRSFTTRYAELAELRPIYKELENLFRFVALAKIMKIKSAVTESGVDLEYFLDRFQLPSTSVSRQLPGRSNVRNFSHRKKIKGGYSIMQLWMPSCGGVGMNIDVSDKNFVKDSSGKQAELRVEVLTARPSSNALSWDVRKK